MWKRNAFRRNYQKFRKLLLKKHFNFSLSGEIYEWVNLRFLPSSISKVDGNFQAILYEGKIYPFCYWIFPEKMFILFEDWKYRNINEVFHGWLIKLFLYYSEECLTQVYILLLITGIVKVSIQFKIYISFLRRIK